MTISEDNSNFYNQVADTIAKEVFYYTPQLFYVKHDKPKLPPYAHSSSILIKAGEEHFLVSAAHNFHDENLETIGIMIESDFCAIGGMLRYWEPNSEYHDPNKLDIAIFKLDDITVDAFKEKYKFLEWEKLGFNHYPSENSRCLLFGYPDSKTIKHAPTKKVTPTSLTLRTVGMQDSYYLENNIDITKFLLLSVPQDQVTAPGSHSPTKLPNLGGISGCGIWSVLNLSVDNPQYELLSIVTGEDSAKTLIYSTKIDILRSIFKSL